MREADEAHQDTSASDNSDRSDEAHDFVDDRHGIDLLHLMILLYQISGCLSIGRLHKDVDVCLCIITIDIKHSFVIS